MRTLFSSLKSKTARTFVMAGLALAMGANAASAQTTTGNAEIDPVLANSNMITLNPLKFFVFYNLNYYHRLSNTMVIGGGLQMPSLKGFSGFGANAELRFHLSGKAMKGIYIAPNVAFNSLKYSFNDALSGLTVNGQQASSGSDEDDAVSTTSFSVGALVGWQWFIGEDFGMGLGIGYDYSMLSLDAEDEDQKENFASYEGGTPAFRFDIGYAF